MEATVVKLGAPFNEDVISDGPADYAVLRKVRHRF